MADGDAATSSQLRKELQRVAAEVEQEQQRMLQRRQQLVAAHARVAAAQSALHTNTARVTSARDAYAEAARTQQALEVAHRNSRGGGSDDDDDDGGGRCGSDEVQHEGDEGDDGALLSREAYLSVLSEKDRECRALQDEVDELMSNVHDLCAAPDGDAQRRLAVARLVSLLDQLRSALEAKVHESASGDAEVRAQECYKTLQELTRERARALRLLQHKERALRDAVALKQRRVRELRAEACRNVGALREANERQVLTVTERIQRERRVLLAEVDRLVVTNDRLAAVLRDTRRTLAASGGDGGDVLGSDSSNSNNNNNAVATATAAAAPARPSSAASPHEAAGDAVDGERVRLQERIAAASAELQRLERRTADIKERMDTDASRYNEKMSHLQAKLTVYHDEATRLEQANKELRAACDALAAELS